jgi:hypothetical protein
MKLPKASEGSAWYQGKFEAPAFRLLRSRAELAEGIYNVLKDFGAASQDFAIEGRGGSSMLVFTVLRANLVVRVKLDSFEITFHSINTVGPKNAIKIGIGCWQAIKACSDSTNLSQHELTIAFQIPVATKQYGEIIATFVNVPKLLPPDTLPGVAFYFPPGLRTGDKGGSIVLDRLATGNELYLTVRTAMLIDAKEVAVLELAKYIDEYIDETLKQLDIEIEN